MSGEGGRSAIPVDVIEVGGAGGVCGGVGWKVANGGCVAADDG